jgi:Tol biopolymer transport system component
MIRHVLAGAVATVLLLPAAASRADSLVGTPDADTLVAGSGPSRARGGGGNDVIYGDGAETHVAGNPVLLSSSAAGAPGSGAVDDGDGASAAWSLSGDGRYVAFASSAPDLTPGDGNEIRDIFVKTLATGAIRRASETQSGVGANGASRSPSLSPDGRFVVFESAATNLAPGDASGTVHIYLKTLSTGAVTRLSQRGAVVADADSFAPVVSPDGRKVAFRSLATNLTGQPTSGASQIYVRTLATGAVEVVSVDAAGDPGNGDSLQQVFSPDSRKLAFTSYATGLVPGDTNASADVFVKTIGSPSIIRVSLDANGDQREGDALDPAFSPDGRRVAFVTYSNTLAPGDSNGVPDVVVKTIASGAIRLVSVEPDGGQSTFPSGQPSFSPDGSRIVFTRYSPLALDPAAPAADLDDGGVYVKDLLSGALSAVETDASTQSTTSYPVEGRFFPSGDRVGYLRVADGTCGNPARCATQVFARALLPVPGAADVLDGGAGDDLLVGGPGADVLKGGSGNDMLLGGTGNDTLVPGAGIDVARGGDGVDTLDLSTRAENLAVSLGSGTARSNGQVVVRYSGVENVIGGRGDDRIVGDAGPNELQGGPGDDILDGGAESPSVIDTASYARATGPIRLAFARGRVVGNASVGRDTFAKSASGFRIDQVIGSRFDDVLDGSGVDLARLEGGPGDDRIIGGGRNKAQRVVYRTAKRAVYVNLATGVGRNRKSGPADVGRDRLVGIDMVSGSDFDDVLVGNDRQNVFNGGAGADVLRGRGGRDEFVLLRVSDSPVTGPDVIADFSGVDLVNLAALGVSRLVTGAIPSGPARVARFRRVSGGGVLDIDLDSDSAAEMRVLLPGVTSFARRHVHLAGDGDP